MRLVEQLLVVLGTILHLNGLVLLQNGTSQSAGWSSWSEWGDCSTMCGWGIKERTRNCTEPPPWNGTALCQGSAYDVDNCPNCSEPESAGWSSWSEWGDCSTMCEWGIKERTRNCTEPPPWNGTALCQGSAYDVDNCQNCSEPDIQCRSYADIYLVVTASDSMLDMPSLMIGLRNGLAGWFARTGNDTQVSVCAYGNSGIEAITPGEPLDATRIIMVGGISRLDLGIECARSSSQKKRRPGAPQYMVLIVSEDPLGVGRADFTGAAREQIRLAREQDDFARITLTTVSESVYGDLISDFADTGYWIEILPDFREFEIRANRDMHALWRQYCPQSAGWSSWSEWGDCSTMCEWGIKERTRNCTEPPPWNGTALCRGSAYDVDNCQNCSEPDTQCRSYADIYLVVTASDTMRDLPSLMIGLRNGLAGWFARTGNDTQVSVCAYGNSGIEAITPGEPLDATRIIMVGGISRLDLGIECARSSSQKNRRPGAPQYMVLIVSEDPLGVGGADFTGAAREQIRLAREQDDFARITLTTVSDVVYGDLISDFSNTGYWIWILSDFTEFEIRANRDMHALWRQYCPPSAGWSYWSHWSECSVSCEPGIRERMRTCSYPPPGNGTAPCRGQPSEAGSCNNGTCPAPRTSSTTTAEPPRRCVVSGWSPWVTLHCPGWVGSLSDRLQSPDWCVRERSRSVIKQPLPPGTCPRLYEDGVTLNSTCYPGKVTENGCFSLSVDFYRLVPCGYHNSIRCLMANCIHMSLNPLCWDTVCQLEKSILACMRRYSDCSERQARSLLPAVHQCLFQSKCQKGTLSQSRCKSLPDESYDYGAILGVDLRDCWGLLNIGRTEAEKKRFAPTVYACIRYKFSEAGLSRSNTRLALDRVQVELGCRENLTDLATLQQLDTRAITFMDFRTNRTTVGVYGDPHLRTYQRPQLTTCASQGPQIYLKSRILDISGVNSKLCPDSRATFLSQVTFEFKSLLNPDVVTARYDARNGQHPVQIKNLLTDVTPVDVIRLEYVNWRRIRMIWNHTGVFIDFSRWGNSYFFTLRVADSVLQSSEGLLVEGCPEDQITDRNPVLTNLADTCDVVAVAGPLEDVTTSGIRKKRNGTIPPTTSQSRQPNNQTILTTTSLPSEAETEPQLTTVSRTVSRQRSLLTAQEAKSACENGSSVVGGGVVLLKGENLEMCMYDVLVTGDRRYFIVAVEAVNSQIEATETDSLITSNIWTFSEEELPTSTTPATTHVTTTSTAHVSTLAGRPRSPPDGCTIDDAKLAGLVALVVLLLIILIILIIIIIILWRRTRSRKDGLDRDSPLEMDDYKLRHKSDKVVEGRYSTLVEKLEKPKMKWSAAPTKHSAGTTLDMTSSSPVENERKADITVSDKSTYLTVINEAKYVDGGSDRGAYIHPTNDDDFPPPPANDEGKLDYLTPTGDDKGNHVASTAVDGESVHGPHGNGTVDYLNPVSDNDTTQNDDNDEVQNTDDTTVSYITPVRASNLYRDLVDDKPDITTPVRAGNVDVTGRIRGEEDYMTPEGGGDIDGTANSGNEDYMAPKMMEM